MACTYLYYTPNFTGLLLPGHGQRKAHHFRRTGLLQHPGALAQCGAGGADIIHEQDPLALRFRQRLIDPQDVGPPGGGLRQAGLGGVVPTFRKSSTGFVSHRRQADSASSFAWS